MSTTPSDQRPGDNWLGQALVEEHRNTLPTMLNVLTILTFVGSSFAFLGALGSFAFAPFSYRSSMNSRGVTDRMGDQMPSFFKTMIGDGIETARLAYVYRVPILLLGLLGAICCFFGALLMRKQRKIGFYLYILGDLLPIVNLIFFTVFSLLTGFAYGISIAVALTFVILYGTQLKYLK